MKITKSIILFGTTALMCACTNEEGIVPGDGGEGTGNYQPSEVPIQLSGSSNVSIAQSAASRAPIFDDGSGTIKNIAIWCLAKDAMQENLAPQDIRWFGERPENSTGCIMNNVKSSINNHKVKWDNPNAKYFYPVSQFYRYEFYANHPYTTDLTFTATSVTANYTIDGTQDLIWGRATSDEPYAWSAKYFRANGGQTEKNLPQLKMEHLLTRLVFFVQPGSMLENVDPEDMDYSAASSMMVDELQICNAYTNLSINIADFNRLDMPIEQRLVRFNSRTDTLHLKDANGAIAGAIQVPDHPSKKTQWGESIMLYPSNDYIVRLVLHDAAGRKFVSEVPLTLKNGDSDFERGKSYNITITVHGPTEIKLGDAELTKWEEVEGPGLNL